MIVVGRSARRQLAGGFARGLAGSFSRRLAGGLFAATLLCALPSPASATSETLKRSIESIICAPFDVLLSPVISVITITDNLRFIDDSPGVQIAYPLPAVGWNTGMVIGIGVIRGIDGLLEFIPGVLLFFSESDIDPLFAPVENSEALFEIDSPIILLRFGMKYTA